MSVASRGKNPSEFAVGLLSASSSSKPYILNCMSDENILFVQNHLG